MYGLCFLTTAPDPLWMPRAARGSQCSTAILPLRDTTSSKQFLQWCRIFVHCVGKLNNHSLYSATASRLCPEASKASQQKIAFSSFRSPCYFLILPIWGKILGSGACMLHASHDASIFVAPVAGSATIIRHNSSPTTNL